MAEAGGRAGPHRGSVHVALQHLADFAQLPPALLARGGMRQAVLQVLVQDLFRERLDRAAG